MKSNGENSGCFVLTLISPVHVGCDEAYEPVGFSVDANGGGLAVFEPFEYVSGLSEKERERFSEICQEGTVESLLEIYKFIHGHPGRGRIVETCRGFLEHHRKILGMKKEQIRNELNKFEIRRTAYNATDQRPYIPGTSVKGALRTGYLNKLANEGPDYRQDLRPPKSNAGGGKPRKFDSDKILSEKLLELDRLRASDKMSMDPFRLVKVSDFRPIGPARTKIIYAVNEKKKPSDKDSRGIPQILEVAETETRFVGEIKTVAPKHEDEVAFAIDLRDLLKASNGFYEREFDRESRELTAIGAAGPNLRKSNGGSLLRIGRHSGAESVTIERYRSIYIKGPGRSSRDSDHATTLWLASPSSNPKNTAELKPFGWCVLSPVSEETARSLETEGEMESSPERTGALNLQTTPAANSGPGPSEAQPPDPPQPAKSPVEKLLDELERINAADMGRLGTVRQKMHELGTDGEKAAIASALREKIGAKAFKKSKWKTELLELINKAATQE